MSNKVGFLKIKSDDYKNLAQKNPSTFYYVDGKQLFLGNVLLSNHLNIENGKGENSLQLFQLKHSFTYNTTNGYQTPVFKSEVLGLGSIGFFSLGNITRNHFLNIGNLNVIEDSKAAPTEDDDGGVIAGYKHYSNSRATSLFGAWNRALNSKTTLITGYRNTAQDGGNIIISGQNNYVDRYGNNSTFGYGLANTWPNACVVGTYNAKSVEGLFEDEYPYFLVGNGYYSEQSIPYEMQEISRDSNNEFDGKTIEEIAYYNHTHKENPLGENLYYKTNYFSFANLIPYPFGNNAIPNKIYKKVYNTRSNAFMVTNQGRALLSRKYWIKDGSSYQLVSGVAPENLGDNDLLTKKEIETIVDKKAVNIQINGTSIVKNGVANIPLASGSKPGVVMTNSNNGIRMGGADSKYAVIECATSGEIDNRAQTYKPIVPYTLDYAVMKALTNPKNYTWSSAQKKLAQGTLGIGSDGSGTQLYLHKLRFDHYWEYDDIMMEDHLLEYKTMIVVSTKATPYNSIFEACAIMQPEDYYDEGNIVISMFAIHYDALSHENAMVDWYDIVDVFNFKAGGNSIELYYVPINQNGKELMDPMELCNYDTTGKVSLYDPIAL